jgi:carbon monoxide dehydrogenase subunit G
MQLENSFTVPVPVDEAWRVLLDIERVAPCMPGAALDSVDGDNFTGRVKVKLGPINLTYQGKASFVEKDEAAHRAVIDARGKDQRGNGTAAAIVTAKLAAEGPITRVDVLTDLNITGRPAQFGRGVMTDVGNKLLGQFADKLAAQLGEGDAQGEAARAGAAATASGAVEEIAASAEQAAGEGPAGTAVKKAAATTKKAAAAVTDKASATDTVAPMKAAKATKAAPAKAAPAKATPAKAAPAEAAKPAAEPAPAPTDTAPIDTAPAATSTPPAATSTAPAPKAPSGPPSGPTAPPSKPASGAPARTVPSAGPTPAARPWPVAEPEPIDLLEVAGGAAMARYAAPAAGIGAAVVMVALVVRRRRRRRRARARGLGGIRPSGR